MKEKNNDTDAEIPQSLYRNFNKKNLQNDNIAINYNNVLLKTYPSSKSILEHLMQVVYSDRSDVRRGKYSFDYYNLDKIPRPYLQGIIIGVL